MGPAGKVRSPTAVILLIAVTSGIYGFIWLHRVIRELRDHTQLVDVTSPGRAVALLFVPVAGALWGLMLAHQLPSWVREMEDQHGRGRTNAALVFVLFLLLFLWPIAVWILQEALNDHWRFHDVHARS
jgi:hypothetical protein